MSDTDLSPKTRLHLAPGIRTRLDAVGHVLVDAPDGTIIDAGPQGFAILSMFARPLGLGAAIERLENSGNGSTDLLPTLSVINMLIEEGALVPLGADCVPTRGWADPVEHARMLHDDRRTSDYIGALRGAVRPEDIVLDIGTGSGVLAIAAARAGARHVYAVEASDIANVAERVFAANGVRDRVTLIRGWSREIELPERADVLVTEVIGNEPFEEEILETTLDARRRLLKPNARLIPHTLELVARPLLIPEAEARQRAIGRHAVERWRQAYGIEFQPLLDAAFPGPVNNPTEGEVLARWPPVGPPVTLTLVELGRYERPVVDASADLAVAPARYVNAVAVTFRAHLHGSIGHTLDPWRWPSSSWATSVWVLPDAVRVGSADALRVRYSRRVPGRPDGLTCDVSPVPGDATVPFEVNANGDSVLAKSPKP
ncbi:MAG TPA: 50S ribosomal protein L11 methyltransferase [Solirubrobacteraceae bacterium]|nr:50S ribosomal protein L11 methyltransferase [Solirubrobacteraceae bacterium]